MKKLLVIFALNFVFASAVSANTTKSVTLNGDSLAGVQNQVIENARVEIDATGNINIVAKGYRVEKVASAKSKNAQHSDSKKTLLVAEATHPGLVDYEVDLFINGRWVERFDDRREQRVIDISKFVKEGHNDLRFSALKRRGQGHVSHSPKHQLRILIGKGLLTKDNVVFDKVLYEYARNASENQNLQEEIVLDAQEQKAELVRRTL